MQKRIAQSIQQGANTPAYLGNKFYVNNQKQLTEYYEVQAYAPGKSLGSSSIIWKAIPQKHVTGLLKTLIILRKNGLAVDYEKIENFLYDPGTGFWVVDVGFRHMKDDPNNNSKNVLDWDYTDTETLQQAAETEHNRIRSKIRFYSSVTKKPPAADFCFSELEREVHHNTPLSDFPAFSEKLKIAQTQAVQELTPLFQPTPTEGLTKK